MWYDEKDQIQTGVISMCTLEIKVNARHFNTESVAEEIKYQLERLGHRLENLEITYTGEGAVTIKSECLEFDPSFYSIVETVTDECRIGA
jgi:hypothetical protein